jgi:hypothetical protein
MSSWRIVIHASFHHITTASSITTRVGAVVSEKIASAQSRQARQGDEVTQQCKPLCYLCLPVPSSKGIHTRSRCSTMDLCPCVALVHQSPCCFHCGSIIRDSEFHSMPCHAAAAAAPARARTMHAMIAIACTHWCLAAASPLSFLFMHAQAAERIFLVCFLVACSTNPTCSLLLLYLLRVTVTVSDTCSVWWWLLIWSWRIMTPESYLWWRATSVVQLLMRFRFVLWQCRAGHPLTDCMPSTSANCT